MRGVRERERERERERVVRESSLREQFERAEQECVIRPEINEPFKF